MDVSKEKNEICVSIQQTMVEIAKILTIMYRAYVKIKNKNQSNHVLQALHYSLRSKIPDQVKHMSRLIEISDPICLENLRMSRNVFGKLCCIIENVGGLRETKNVTISEQVAIFLSVLAHHKKNCVVKNDFIRSGRTISKHFNNVLNIIIKLHGKFLVDPSPVPEDSQCSKWKWFKGCLGALDGTYINVRVPAKDKARYRTRKGDVAVNVLGVCDRDMKFIYVLSGWEGSAADGRVLRDAISRPNGLMVPCGNYYLCDSGYTNGEGFLTPYRGIRYHLREWDSGPSGPQNCEEFFNLKHSSARNVIERAFGLPKMRWAILRSASFYPIKVQNRIRIACCLLNNFICSEMTVDPLEASVSAQVGLDDN